MTKFSTTLFWGTFCYLIPSPSSSFQLSSLTYRLYFTITFHTQALYFTITSIKPRQHFTITSRSKIFPSHTHESIIALIIHLTTPSKIVPSLTHSGTLGPHPTIPIFPSPTPSGTLGFAPLDSKLCAPLHVTYAF